VVLCAHQPELQLSEGFMLPFLAELARARVND
jgi:hypothetical protein